MSIYRINRFILKMGIRTNSGANITVSSTNGVTIPTKGGRSNLCHTVRQVDQLVDSPIGLLTTNFSGM